MDIKSQPPAINAPRIILILSGVMIGIYVISHAASTELGREMILYLSLIPARFAEPGLFQSSKLGTYLTLISYSFLHANLTHIALNLITMLAFGSIAAWRLGFVKFLILSAICSIGGGLLHLATHWGELVPVIGASAVVSGHMAVAARFLDKRNSFFLARGVSVRSLTPMGIPQILKSQTALIFLGFWVAINLLIGLGGGALGDELSRIAWQAHFGGFIAGFVVFPFLDNRLSRA